VLELLDWAAGLLETARVIRARIVPGVAVLLTLALGMGVRALSSGDFAKYAGDAFYAQLIFFLIVFVAPGMRPVLAAAVATAVCWAIEFAQLMPWVGELAERSTLARLALGSTFNAPDLLAYPVGAAVGLALLLLVRGAGR
jgi:hypothetical protein